VHPCTIGGVGESRNRWLPSEVDVPAAKQGDLATRYFRSMFQTTGKPNGTTPCRLAGQAFGVETRPAMFLRVARISELTKKLPTLRGPSRLK
jgi:hypothetical protein